MVDFEVHKITIETLGEYLSAVRKDLGVSAEAVAIDIGIAPKLMHALESGSFTELPEPVYVVAILKKLAGRYSIPSAPLLAEFNRELEIATQPSGVKTGTWQVLAHRLAPFKWTSIFAMACGVLFLGLCVWQVFAIGTTPRVKVTTPKAGERVHGGLVVVSGSATPGSEVLVNGQVVYAGSDGLFSSSLSFMPGTQTLVVSAKSRFGKVKSQSIPFVVEGTDFSNMVGPSLADIPLLN